MKLQQNPMQSGTHLRHLANSASFGGFFLSLFGTAIVWAGSDAFNCSATIWKVSIGLNIVFFFLTWIIYLPFRNTDLLLGHGILSLFILFSFFWLMGFAGIYFYFTFAPISIWVRVMVLCITTLTLLYRVYIIGFDTDKSFKENKNLFYQIYCDSGDFYTYNHNSFLILQKARKDRNPFKSIHAYAAMLVTPFALILDRISSPFLGHGHVVFFVLSFFCIPILLWGAEILSHTVITMIYYPFKLQSQTGKPVLLKYW